MKHLVTIAALAAVLAPPLARADQRYYGETYNASIAPKGALDVELWSTLYQPKSGHGPQSWVHQLELETGLTDHWDIALYNIFRYEQGDTTRYQATQVESRYRLSDPGEWFVDPVLYLELRKEWIEDKPWAVEEKLILGKDIDRLNLSVNLTAEQEFIPDGGGQELEYGYAAGASWELLPWLRAGGEAFGSWRHSTAEDHTASQHYAGPAISLAVARSWLVLAAGFGLTDESDKLRARAILAFQF
ncbi:hypothetical protein [Anaeromyxobacter paludicola]|uniref:Uncharacterized protein n=1 Tax=Anaeromyxobacter paludicola TaxID=2918171 RepID=A0ABM7X7G7_9BACT|nr:hypothetical protein [Anaeromyxobacter paludicola]BDG07782.1 hypothetical protein AMPC_08950 [Anaeromyxobacter paludicola]